MVQVPSTKIFATGTLKILHMCLISVMVLFLAEAAAGISDAVPKLHQNTISVLGKSRTIGLSEEGIIPCDQYIFIVNCWKTWITKLCKLYNYSGKNIWEQEK
jgi:hypothetical protein